MYDLDSEDELNGDFIIEEDDDNSGNDNKGNIPRSKVQPIRKTK